MSFRFFNIIGKVFYGCVYWLSLMLSFSKILEWMIKGVLCIFIKESGDC